MFLCFTSESCVSLTYSLLTLLNDVHFYCLTANEVFFSRRWNAELKYTHAPSRREFHCTDTQQMQLMNKGTRRKPAQNQRVNYLFYTTNTFKSITFSPFLFLPLTHQKTVRKWLYELFFFTLKSLSYTHTHTSLKCTIQTGIELLERRQTFIKKINSPSVCVCVYIKRVQHLCMEAETGTAALSEQSPVELIASLNKAAEQRKHSHRLPFLFLRVTSSSGGWLPAGGGAFVEQIYWPLESWEREKQYKVSIDGKKRWHSVYSKFQNYWHPLWKHAENKTIIRVCVYVYVSHPEVTLEGDNLLRSPPVCWWISEVLINSSSQDIKRY